MAQEITCRILDCSWCLEEIENNDNVYLLEQELILHESCYKTLSWQPIIIGEDIYKK